jgi:hypothetical protein
MSCSNRVIHKSLRYFRPLRFSSRDGHAEEEHINRGRGTPIFCPTLQVLDMSTLGDAADVNPVIKFLPHTLQHLAVDSSIGTRKCPLCHVIYHSCDEVSWRQSLLSAASCRPVEYRPATSWVHYNTSSKHSLMLLKMGEIIARNMLS